MKRSLYLLGLALPLASIAAQPPSQIDVFTDAAHPIENVAAVKQALGEKATVRTFHIDAQARLNETLSKNLPADRDKAKAIALERIQALNHTRLRQALTESFDGLMLAQRYGIDRYPAIVFDGGKRVVYGVVDLREALRLYRQSATRREQ